MIKGKEFVEFCLSFTKDHLNWVNILILFRLMIKQFFSPVLEIQMLFFHW